jgi:hypothetical protein
MVKAIVCGGRDYRNVAHLTRVLEAATERLGVDAIVQGGALGADRLAKEWASHRGLQCETFYADWAGEGKKAGALRNAKMLTVGAEICIAFPGGRGTADMVRQATKAGLRVIHITA